MSLQCQVHALLLLVIAVGCVLVESRSYNNGLIFYDLQAQTPYLPPTVSVSRGRGLASVKYSAKGSIWSTFGQPCECSGMVCGCCAGIKVQQYDFDQKMCANITYMPTKKEALLEVYLNEKPSSRYGISTRNPSPFCIPVMMGVPMAMCVQMSNIAVQGNNLNMCMDFVVRLATTDLFEMHFQCMKMGLDGVQYVDKNGRPVIPPSSSKIETTESADDEYYDETAESVTDSEVENENEMEVEVENENASETKKENVATNEIENENESEVYKAEEETAVHANEAYAAPQENLKESVEEEIDEIAEDPQQQQQQQLEEELAEIAATEMMPTTVGAITDDEEGVQREQEATEISEAENEISDAITTTLAAAMPATTTEANAIAAIADGATIAAATTATTATTATATPAADNANAVNVSYGNDYNYDDIADQTADGADLAASDAYGSNASAADTVDIEQSDDAVPAVDPTQSAELPQLPLITEIDLDALASATEAMESQHVASTTAAVAASATAAPADALASAMAATATTAAPQANLRQLLYRRRLSLS